MKIRIKEGQEQWLCGNIIILITAFVLLIVNNKNISLISSTFLLVVNLLIVWRVKKNWALLIIMGFILYSNISIVFANYFGFVDNFFTSFSKDYSSIVGMNMLVVFISLLNFIIPFHINDTKDIVFFKTNKKNTYFFVSIFIVLVLIYFFGFSKPDVIGQRGYGSAIYEYSIILFILGYCFTSKRRYTILLSLLLFLYVIQDLQYGGRSTAIQLLIVFFLVVLSGRVKVLNVMPVVLILLIVFTAIGGLRAQFNLSLDTILYAVQRFFSTGFINDTSYSAYYTSLTFIKVGDILPISQKLYMLFQFFIYIFIGSSAENSNLAVFTRDYYVHYYGGVLPLYVHFYLGVIGIALIVLYLRIWIKKIASIKYEKNILIQCICIYIIATVPRWYLYSPSALFRGVLILTVIHITLDFFNTYAWRK